MNNEYDEVEQLVVSNCAFMSYSLREYGIELPPKEYGDPFMALYSYNYKICTMKPEMIKILKEVIEDVENGKHKKE